MFQWVRMEAFKSGFGIVIKRSDSGSDRRHAFAMMRCEINDQYKLSKKLNMMTLEQENEDVLLSCTGTTSRIIP